MNKYRKEVSIEILVGLFVFIVLIALGVFTIILSHENLMQKRYAYEFVFPEVGGLREGDNVYTRGMVIGRVKQITLQDQRVHVYASVRIPLQFHQDYRIEVVDSSMLGGKFLKITEGSSTTPLIPENMPLRGSPPIDLVDELASAVHSLRTTADLLTKGEGTLGKMMTDDSLYKNLSKIGENLEQITDRLNRGEGSLGRLLADDDGALYENAKVTMENIRYLTDSLAKGEGTLGHLLSTNDTVYTDLQVTMANLRSISSKIDQGDGVIGKLLASDDSFYEDLQATMRSVRNISESIDEGKGTMGKLVKDDTLYDQTTLLVEDVRAAIDDLREASPITSFGSILFGAF